jgi:hypothetical protein
MGPVFLGCELRKIKHQACFNEIIGILAGIELRGTHGVAAEDARNDDGAGNVTGTGNGAIDPFVASGIESFCEFGNGGGFAA